MPASGIKKGTVSQSRDPYATNKLRRKDGSYIRFDDNAVVTAERIRRTRNGTMFSGPVARNCVIKDT